MEKYQSIYTLVLYLNIPLAICSFGLAFVFLYRANLARRVKSHDPIYFNFGAAVLSMGLWITSILVLYSGRVPSTILSPERVFDLTLVPAICILHYFYIFTLYYPYPLINSEKKKFIVYCITIPFLISILIPRLYSLHVQYDFPFLRNSYNFVGLAIFSSYFGILSFLGFINLYRKYKVLAGFQKINLRLVLYGTYFALIINWIVGINIYFWTDFNIAPVGALFTSFVLYYIIVILTGIKIRIVTE